MNLMSRVDAVGDCRAGLRAAQGGAGRHGVDRVHTLQQSPASRSAQFRRLFFFCACLHAIRSVPLLFKGDDLSRTDVQVAA